MDAGFYSADYLRAWIRHAQLRAYLIEEVGADWWRSPQTGEILRDLFVGCKVAAISGEKSKRPMRRIGANQKVSHGLIIVKILAA